MRAWTPVAVLGTLLALATCSFGQDGTTVDLGPESTTRTAAPGETITVALTLANPTAVSQSYSLEASEPPAPWAWTIEPPNATVSGQNGTVINVIVHVPRHTADLGNTTETRTFTVTARNDAVPADSDNVSVRIDVRSPDDPTTTPSSPGPSSTTTSLAPTGLPNGNATDPASAGGTGPGRVAWPWDGVYLSRPAATALVAGGSGGILLGLLALSESVRFRARLLALLLFSRFEREGVLDHGTRERIYETIRRTPGVHYGGLRRHLELAAGTLTHHLFMLEREELVRSQRDGFRKRFYPRGRADWGPAPLTAIERSIVDLVHEEPGILQGEVASHLGISKQVASYHLRKLERLGRVHVERLGRAAHCYPARGAAAPAPPEA
ncbi:MAG TPA: winged helix-turn-helix transcriptional regulator [Planctomycetota bacterium]|nr:winged helix-turn-helix transcriptional regulator [Planctomycetota bacterium]